ncbi:MAG: acetyltransferase [Sphingobium sp.]|nr:acetyltransferase [Sphingobium sp.]
MLSKRFEAPGRIGENNLLEVKLARSEADRDEACGLVNRMYDWRGYGHDHVIPQGDGHSTFLASLDKAAVGTITLAVDMGDGLAADAIFRDELNIFRRIPGASLCELTKFAFDADIPSRKLLASLFHIVFIYGTRHHRCTHLFIEVNPRHRRFYEAMLGFQPVGAIKTNECVQAPSQLMWLEVSDIAGLISEQAGSNAANSRSLYPLFLSRRDERDVRSRLSDALFAPPASGPAPAIRN